MDTPAAPDPNLNARLAVLEEIAAATKAGLIDMRAEIRSLRGEIRDELREMRTETVSGFDTLRSEHRAMRLISGRNCGRCGRRSEVTFTGCWGSYSAGSSRC